MTADLVVIDEFGDPSTFAAGRDGEVSELIDGRYGQKLATLIITNMDAVAFAAAYGPKIARRVIQTGGLEGAGGFHNADWPIIDAAVAAAGLN